MGTSFSPRRCLRFRIPIDATFERVLGMGFGLVRLSAYWDQVSGDGYTELDRLLDMAAKAGQSVVLTVGMKAMQWPEFYLPTGVHPDPRSDGRVGHDPGFRREVLAFVSATVARYRDRKEIAAWQVENEPFNRSGPKQWWIDPGLLRREIEAVRSLDSRPIVVNAFAHFDARLDRSSRPRRDRFDPRRVVPERAILDLLRSGDVLGLDVYTAIGAVDEGAFVVRTSDPDWADTAGRWMRTAEAEGKEGWIVEAQAEPWEEPGGNYAEPRSFAPEVMGRIFERLAAEGCSTILLWGCEYWFWRDTEGDTRWLDAARLVLAR